MIKKRKKKGENRVEKQKMQRPPTEEKSEKDHLNTESIYSLQNIEDLGFSRNGAQKSSILKNSSKLGSSSFLDPNNSMINMKKKTTFREDLVEIREVESWKDFNYEHTYNVENSQCKCDCVLI